MHVGERPYVLSPSGPANLSERPLTVDAMGGVLTDLLSADDQHTLSDVGAVEREILLPEAPGDRFLLVAARNGDDIWVELRRQRGAAPGRRVLTPPSIARPPAPPDPEPSYRPRMAPSHGASAPSPARAAGPPTPAGAGKSSAPTCPRTTRSYWARRAD